LNVEDILEAAGTITGFVETAKLTDLSAVPGVAAVEPARSY